MAEDLKAFKDAMRRQENRRAPDATRRDDRASGQTRSAVEAGNARYQGYIATINNMRDRDIERAMTGR